MLRPETVSVPPLNLSFKALGTPSDGKAYAGSHVVLSCKLPPSLLFCFLFIYSFSLTCLLEEATVEHFPSGL